MKALVYRLKSNPKYTKAFYWGKYISITGSTQVIVQAISLFCGLLIIRFLSPNEYALYTLANMILSTMTVLAECDISSAVMAQGGKVWRDPKKLGIVLVTAFDIRRKFGIVSMIFVTPVLFYLLLHHGASWGLSVLIILSIIPAFFATLSDTLLEVPPKLVQDIAPLQKNLLQASFVRLFLTAISIVLFPWAFIAILTGGLPRIWANIGLKKISRTYIDWQQKVDDQIRKEILTFVKRILPMAIFYGFSGQVTIWLISIFGSATAVAQIGALSRLAAFLGLISVLFATLVVPRFARLPANRKILFTYFMQIMTGLLTLTVSIVGIAYFFSPQVLWILGSSYSALQTELVLSILGSGLALIAGAIYSLNLSRGWTINPFLYVTLTVITISVVAALIDVSTLKGVLVFNILTTIIYVLINGIYGLTNIIKIKNNQSEGYLPF